MVGGWEDEGDGEGRGRAWRAGEGVVDMVDVKDVVDFAVW